MSLGVVLFTRSSRPSGAQMAWRLFQSGYAPVAIIVEKRGRMAEGKGDSRLSLLFRLGFGFVWKRILEAVRVQTRYFLRKYFPGQFKDTAYFSIEEWALDHPSVPVFEVDDHNSVEVQELLWRLEPDLGVLTNTRRIKKEVLEIPRHGFFNLHLSELPKYAGLDSIFWALYHGEKEIGVTVHEASPEIDRGAIVLQRKIPVNSRDDEETLYEKALWLGTSLMVRAVKQLEVGATHASPLPERRPQDPSRASYCSWPTAKERSVLRKKRHPLTPTLSPFRGRGKGEGVIRVLHLITRMTRGGAQENTLATVLGQREKGYEVTLVTGPSWGKEGEILSEALEKGVDVAVLPELTRELHPWKDFRAFFRFLFWLRKFQPVIVHTHMSKAGFLGRLAARLARVPIVIHTPHGHVFHSYFPRWEEKLFLAIEKIAAGWADRLIALTERCRLEHLELGVGKEAQWVTIPSGVNESLFSNILADCEKVLGQFGILPGKKIVGFVGRLAPVKGAHYFIEALPALFKTAHQIHVLLVGDGEERKKLQSRVRELRAEGRVTFTGHRDDIPEILSALDILVVPSLNEGMGRVIVEAGLLAKPVIGTKVGGIPDLILHEETGLLVMPRDPAALAGAVLFLLENPGRAKTFGENLYKRVRAEFTETRMMQKINAIYEELLSKMSVRQPQAGPPLVESKVS